MINQASNESADHFIVRTRGSWFLTSLPVSHPREVSSDEVIALLAGPVSVAPSVAALPFHLTVEPIWSLVARVVDGVLWTEDGGGVPFSLDAVDVRILDRVDRRVSVADVVGSFGDDSIAGRVARLSWGGRLVVSEPLSRVVADGVVATSAGGVRDVGVNARSFAVDSIRAATVAVGRVRVGVSEALRSSSRVRSVRARFNSTSSSDSGGRFDRVVATGERVAVEVGLSSVVPAPLPVESVPSESSTGLVPVYTVWDREVGPMLSHGMLTAAARHHDGGALTRTYEIRRPETADSFLDDLAARPGPAVLLCSDYVWSLARNIELARVAVSINPELTVIHGGPSSPKYVADAERFLADFGDVAHVLVRGEGERVLCQLLEVLGGDPCRRDPDALAAVPGLTFRDDRTGEVVRTPDQERIADLDSLPSPYLTGEFDHIEPEAWVLYTSFETCRGCPYGCTFCDWGSATLSRLRKFSVDRVKAEFDWAAEKGLAGFSICDSNFGIMKRDVEFAAHLAAVKRATGWPHSVSFGPAKNTTKHLTKIFDHLLGAGIMASAAISLQTTDPVTLEAVERQNISTDAYLALAADLRRRGQPLQGDVIMGLPGMTLEAYKADLQLFLDHEIMPRTWLAKLLPNSPMNDPDYKRQFGVEANDVGVVIATEAMDAAERLEALQLRDMDIVCERFGLLRHVMRYLQWDHDIPSVTFMERLLETITHDAGSIPALAWSLSYFESFATAAGWHGFYEDVRTFVVNEFGLDPDDSGLRCVLAVQRALMPWPGRTFPFATDIAHDYVRYYREATASLYASGRAKPPTLKLKDLPPARFEVLGDPLEICTGGPPMFGRSDDDIIESEFHLGQFATNELLSPLIRLLPGMGGTISPVDGPAIAAEIVSNLPEWAVAEYDAMMLSQSRSTPSISESEEISPVTVRIGNRY